MFIFFFSLLFKQSQYIFLFFAITAAIFAGGSGSAIIGGLYWKRGTTGAAWASLITGSSIAVGGIIIHQIQEDFFINGQVFWAISMAASVIVYVTVSLLSRKPEYNLDKLLHRGEYAIEEETQNVSPEPARGLKILGIGKEFSRGDKILYYITYGWTFLWTLVFIFGTIYNLVQPVSDSAWMKYWRISMEINVAVSIIVIVWFLFGGVRDLKAMFGQLRTMKRDDSDSGFITREEA